MTTHERRPMLIDVSDWTYDQIEQGLSKLAPVRYPLPQRKAWVDIKMAYVRRGFAVTVDRTCRIQKKPEATPDKTYLIRKDGKYLSSLFPIAFAEPRPVAGRVYQYTSVDVALNVARQLDAQAVSAIVIGSNRPRSAPTLTGDAVRLARNLVDASGGFFAEPTEEWVRRGRESIRIAEGALGGQPEAVEYLNAAAAFRRNTSRSSRIREYQVQTDELVAEYRLVELREAAVRAVA